MELWVDLLWLISKSKRNAEKKTLVVVVVGRILLSLLLPESPVENVHHKSKILFVNIWHQEGIDFTYVYLEDSKKVK